MTELTARKVIVSGKVQGVSFRDFVRPHAQTLGLQGYVRNRCDGGVEALFIGTEDRLETILTHCRKGPAASRVEKVEVTELELENATVASTLPGFHRLPTV